MGNPWALTEWQKEIDSYLIKTFDVVIVWKVDRFRVGSLAKRSKFPYEFAARVLTRI